MINQDIDKNLKKIVDYEIMQDLDNEDFHVAQRKLLKMFSQYYDKVKIDTKWSILYRLIYAENNLEHYELVKKYTEILKQDMDKVENQKYIQANKGKYADVLSYYIDAHKDELSNEEMINLHKKAYSAYSKYVNESDGRNFLCMINTKFNLYLLLNNEDIILEIIKKVSSLHNVDSKIMLKEMLQDIKNKDLDLYKKSMLLIQ